MDPIVAEHFQNIHSAIRRVYDLSSQFGLPSARADLAIAQNLLKEIAAYLEEWPEKVREETRLGFQTLINSQGVELVGKEVLRQAAIAILEHNAHGGSPEKFADLMEQLGYAVLK